MRYFLLMFILMPIAEMWLLITVGTYIGALATITLVLLTALVGVALLREQGIATLWRGREKLQEGQLPTTEIAEGIILAVSGALLLTPGFVTDTIGFTGLIPFTRVAIARLIMSKIQLIGANKAQFQGAWNQTNTASGHDKNGNTFDGEAWERKDLE
ncbi:MAG: FxsA family protein [Porticoccaceae bacterium]|nr:FxsA family protein [Porticoccaceae bacterium]MDG1474580.1 FxsA family protein [Porticoccaceae bacterium]